MKLVALLRVSTRGQAEDGYGLDAQEAAVRAWAKKHRHKLVAVVTEQVSGAAPFAERKGLTEAQFWVARGKAEGIVVPRLDRLSRTLHLQEQIIAGVEASGGVVRSVNPTEDAQLVGETDDPERRLIRQILGSIHEYERHQIRIRLRAGREAKEAAGGYVGGGPPYGWAASGKQLVPIPAEQETRRRMKAWAREGWSTRKIAARLNAEGIPTRMGKPWGHSSVARILNNPRRGVNSPAPAIVPESNGEVA